MSFLALLVSADSEAAAALAPVLSSFGLGLRCCVYGEAFRELTEQKFDALIVDFEDPQQAALVLQNAYLASPRNAAVTVALLSDQTKVRSAFGAGAHFVLYKPISAEHAQASLRAATILIKRERRRSSRIPVQVPVQLLVTGLALEAILLDLSEEGMELLASSPLCPSAALDLQFRLPGNADPVRLQGEVAWASPNGQTGVRFTDLPDPIRRNLAGWVANNATKLPSEEPDPVASYKLTDISQGGCYVETESPFPEHTVVVLSLQAADSEVQVQGMVRVMHPEFGMGIEFASRTMHESERLRSLIRFLMDTPGTRPELLITPRGLASGPDLPTPDHAANELIDPLLDLLRSHELLSQSDFLQQLRQQRRPAEAAVCQDSSG
jgi:CheY-like chemotaxis protein